ncbi:hypothetical protein [Actinokineospora sp. HUAS TT18]|uniref:hypothetical protein n=1 Tax=Actinokineospora sp. HUAS TT18 TaxID=3447451 RepID=UPI003F51FD10
MERPGWGWAYRRLYAALREVPAISTVDGLLPRLELPRAGVRELGLRLATTAGDREPVKYGIALLGAAGDATDLGTLRVLGRHDEFTLFAAVAVVHIGVDVEDELWALARQVDGWGRIQAVERLKGTGRADIKDWILRTGFRNSVMSEYLAHLAATTGDLVAALEQPDDEMLTAACDIVSALIMGGPAEGIEDYSDGRLAIALLLGHLAERASTLRHLLVVDEIESYLADDELAAVCREIKGRDLWPTLIEDGLRSSDDAAFYQAERAAQLFGIDTFAAHWARVVADPLGSNWFLVMERATGDTIDEVVAFAERAFPLADIASGPADVLGLGPEFRAHQALGFVVQDLGRFPGRGWPLVDAALRSPVVNNRNMALNVIEAWETWPAAVRPALEVALRDEPTPDVRERIRALLDRP